MLKEKIDLNNKTILVTGSAGFIGFYLSKRLLEEINNVQVIGLDSVNDYYDVSLKEYRLDILNKYENFTFIKGNLADKQLINKTFEDYKPNVVVNLAAQAGVRYSIDHPDVYIESNLIGFYNILEACRYNPVEHLVYASSMIKWIIQSHFMLQQRSLMNCWHIAIANFIIYHQLD